MFTTAGSNCSIASKVSTVAENIQNARRTWEDRVLGPPRRPTDEAMRQWYPSNMKVAQGRVVNGAVVSETPLPEGARVAILLDDDEDAFELEPEDEAAIESATKALDAGQGKPVAELNSLLDQYR